VASIPEHTTSLVLPEAEIDYGADLNDDLDNELWAQGDDNSQVDTEISSLMYKVANEYLLAVVTQNRLMNEMLLQHQVQWKAEQRFAQVRIEAKSVKLAAIRDQRAAECLTHAKLTAAALWQKLYIMIAPSRCCSVAYLQAIFVDMLC